jgi:hypothetical protein
MHTSIHLTQVQIPNSENNLLLHTLRGALDIIPQEVANAVQNFDESAGLLSEAEIKTLKQRGYLTEQTVQQELDQAQAVMRLASKNFRRLVELTFPLPRPLADAPARKVDRSDIEGIFSLGSKMAGDEGMVVVCLDISSREIEADSTRNILEAALERDYPIMPSVTIGGLDVLSSWGKSEYFNQATLVSDSSVELSDFDGLAAKIIDLFERQIHTSWTCKIDGMSAAQLEAILGVREQVRLKYPNFIVCLLANECEGTGAPGMVTVGGFKIPFMSLENETILRTLLRFILMPNVVNYKPFFQPPNQKLEIDLENQILTYEEGSGKTFKGGPDEMRAYLETELAHRGTANLWEEAQSAAECLACKYALVCGRDWFGQGGFPEAQQCARSFEQRIAQTLPLLLFMLRGNWRPLESTHPQVGPV